MRKIILLTFITFFGWLGWRLGESFGPMIAYWLSFCGSLAGVVAGCLVNRRYLG